MVRLLSLIAAILIGVFRPFLLNIELGPHVMASYQAVAHLYVGGAFVAWKLLKSSFYKTIFWALCAVEVLCAAIKVLG
jgi:hypothetical protein